MQETWVLSLGREDPLEKEMAAPHPQYSCLGNPVDWAPWWATVHGVAKESDSTSQLNNNNMLTTINNATMNFGVCVSFWSSDFIYFLNVDPRMELPDHIVVLFLVFWGIFILVSIVTISTDIPTNIVQGFPLQHPCHTVCRLSDDSSPDRCEIIPYLVLICIFLAFRNIEHLFMCY